MHQVDIITVEAESGIGGLTDLLRLFARSSELPKRFLRRLRNRSAATPMPRRDRRRNA